MVERQMILAKIRPVGGRACTAIGKDKARTSTIPIYCSLLLRLLNLRTEKLKIVTTSCKVNVYLQPRS